MKKLFGPAWVSAWLAGWLPDSVYFIGKKTPWYRKSWKAYAPWIAGALVAPLAIFLTWKGISRLQRRPAGEQ